jgi:tetratricopeptide (TPR) repeat protein
MMRTYLWILLCFGLGSALAQNRAADSIQKILRKEHNEINRVQLLNALSDAYKPSEPLKIRQFGQQAQDLALKIGDNIGEGNALINLGNSYVLQSDYRKALALFQKAKSIFESENQTNPDVKIGLAKSLGSLGIIFSEQSNYTKALEFYLKAVTIYDALGEQDRCARLYNNIGVLYQSQKSYFKALSYFAKTEKLLQQKNDPILGVTYTNIGNSYRGQGQLEKANSYYNKAKVILIKNKDARGLGELYNNLGLLFQESKKETEALQAWNAAEKEFTAFGETFGLSDTYYYLAAYWKSKGNSTAARFYAEKTKALAQTNQVLEQQMLVEKLLSELAEKEGDLKESYQHFKAYSQLKDSIQNEASIRRGVEAELNFEFDKRNLMQKEALLKKDLLLQETAKRNRLQLIYSVLIAVLLFGLGFLWYNRLQIKKTLTLQKELAEYEQKALHLQMNPHFVFNCLGSISSFIVNNGKESAVKYLAKFSKLMRLTLEFSKESLISVDKEIDALQNYLELEQLRFNSVFTFTIEKSEEIEDNMGLPPLLIQPFVENAIIHGIVPKKNSGEITIQFDVVDEQLKCYITDNGIGITASQKIKEKSVSVHKSMAIEIIRMRLEKIASTTGKSAGVTINELTQNGNVIGTEVVLSIPLQFLEQ